jgi:putative restriction endonuclease
MVFQGEQVRFVGPQGIFKPRVLERIPLTITTAPDGPYDDAIEQGGLLRYKYRGTDTRHPDNVGLRLAMQHQVPLIYFHGIARGRYVPAWPVYVVADDPAQLTFGVAVDDVRGVRPGTTADPEQPIRRAYATRTYRQRLHQEKFRYRVLRAYREHCALCRLRHEQLLDAAHIVSDSEGGEASIPNGMALCKLHHAAFDKHVLAIRPDYVVEVRGDIRRKKDGPMLIHGLQEFHGQRILLPRSRVERPSPELLEQRYERFRALGAG